MANIETQQLWEKVQIAAGMHVATQMKNFFDRLAENNTPKFERNHTKLAVATSHQEQNPIIVELPSDVTDNEALKALALYAASAKLDQNLQAMQEIDEQIININVVQQQRQQVVITTLNTVDHITVVNEEPADFQDQEAETNPETEIETENADEMAIEAELQPVSEELTKIYQQKVETDKQVHELVKQKTELYEESKQLQEFIENNESKQFAGKYLRPRPTVPVFKNVEPKQQTNLEQKQSTERTALINILKSILGPKIKFVMLNPEYINEQTVGKNSESPVPQRNSIQIIVR